MPDSPAKSSRAPVRPPGGRDAYLARLGHDLRNPLAAMVHVVELLKLRDGALDRELSIFDRQLGHLTHIVGELHDLSTVGERDLRLFREPVELCEAVAQARDAARAMLEERRLVVEIARGLVVDADRMRLAQVLANLLTNAAKFTPCEGEIRVSARTAGESIEIAVRDDGQGIEPSLLPRIFEPFVPREHTAQRGIGLSLVRTLVELHGGSIRAQSRGPGTGSTFTLAWPRALPAAGRLRSTG